MTDNSTTESDSTHFDMHSSPKKVDSIDQIEGVANMCLGNSVWVLDTNELENGTYIAYLGGTLPYDTTIGDREISMVNYAPIGAIHATPQNDGEYYTLELPDQDALNEALLVREQREAVHRSSLFPGLTNMLSDRQQMHAEEADKYAPESDSWSVDELDLDDEELYEFAFNRGMQKMANVVSRRISQHLQTPYAGAKRWEGETTADNY